MVEAELVGPAANEAEITAVADEKADETGTKDVRLEELPDKPIWDSIALPPSWGGWGDARRGHR